MAIAQLCKRWYLTITLAQGDMLTWLLVYPGRRAIYGVWIKNTVIGIMEAGSQF